MERLGEKGREKGERQREKGGWMRRGERREGGERGEEGEKGGWMGRGERREGGGRGEEGEGRVGPWLGGAVESSG